NFMRTTVFIAEHSDEGAVGVVLNRPSDTDVAGVLPDWGSAVSSPAVVFVGGPVAQEGALALARVGGPGLPEVGFQPVVDGLGVVDLESDSAVLAPQLAGMRVYAGYAGWGPGQLDAEIAEGAWYVVTGAPDDVFCSQPEVLWRDVLRRQGGELALVSTFPPDPTLN
ncbi:MAG TPA: YqgE/AlgH family protein, partial [Mycobacteriales bacterium]|nr:YqgE/AlgH family protein [Mycobacteriales bacterium]